MARKSKITIDIVAPVVVVASSVLGAAGFLLFGFVILIFTGFGADAGTGWINSQPVILALTLLPPIAPLVAWLLLRLKRHWEATVIAAVGIAPAPSGDVRVADSVHVTRCLDRGGVEGSAPASFSSQARLRERGQSEETMDMMGGPRIKHVDDVREQEVVRIEFEDGRSASVRERFVEQLPNFLSFYNRWDPGMMQRKHGHHGHHVVFILSGSMMVGDTLCTKGSHIFLMHGDTFGPWIAGPEGCETLGVVAGHGASFASPEDDAAFLDLLAEHGARRAAVPKLTNRPPWSGTGNPLPGPVY